MALSDIVGRYITVGDVRMYVEEAGTGAPLVCLHSAGTDGTEWHYTLRAAERLGVRAIALDLPGHGKSAMADGGPIDSIAGFRSIVLGAIEQLALERPLVVGCSIGGAIALELAIQDGTRLEAVLVAAASARNRPFSRTFLRMGREESGSPSAGERAALGVYASSGLRAPGDRLVELADLHRRADPRVLAADLHAWSSFDARADLSAASCPVTIVYGSDDFYLDQHDVDRTADVLGSGPAIRLEGIGHFPMIEHQDFNEAALLPFLAGRRDDRGGQTTPTLRDHAI